MDAGDPTFLTTKEVADLLRVKERKVYDLAAAEEIPHRRITGKLLFPRTEIMAWIEGGDSVARDRPPVLAGSHDPLLDWAVRESGCGLATLLDGSAAGLNVFAESRAALTGLHLPDDAGWNVGAVMARNLTNCVLIGWADRARGLILARTLEGQVSGLSDLRGRRVVLRQPGAGAAELMARLLAEAKLSDSDLTAHEETARTEADAAALVAAGEADASLGLAAMAKRFNLPFVPLITESFDLLVDRRAYFTDPVQCLLAFANSSTFEAKAAAMGGYNLGSLGQVRWISP